MAVHSRLRTRETQKGIPPSRYPLDCLAGLFKGNFRSLSLKFRLEFLSLSLGNALFHHLRSLIDHCLRLFQAKSGRFADNLDNLNLVRADLGQLNIEGILLFLCRSVCRCRHYNARRCGYAELFLAGLYQFV